jgi:hypothetical protein
MRSAVAIARNPAQALSTAPERWIEKRQQRTPPRRYPADPRWERRLHEGLAVALPCGVRDEFDAVWREVTANLDGLGIAVGPESFVGWNDGDAALSRAVWCLTRHLRPNRVVETGVAHGITTRFILEALERNQHGHLWSIDLPPQLYPDLHGRIGIAVSDQVRHRWTYVKGSSRRRLPPLLERLGSIDLFVHDSLHSERNVLFETAHAWPALTPGGVLVVDDIDANSGFATFASSVRTQFALICEAEPVRPDHRRFNAKGLFGIVRKPV